ncbi:oligosaccharide flippase family protein [Sphingomonas silueang]|uniref:oligosaccharide flippase family protein n=1 Tax=Sphingomonas silueang TaxID=3156617 RepID=UPI0032B508FC
MGDTNSSIAGKSVWTMGVYVASLTIRFGGNIALSRLLGPEIMGVAVIAQAIRTGSELLTDFGFEQNVVRSAQGEVQAFLDTIWTMQILRGLIVSLACLALSPLLAAFYRIDPPLLMAISAVPLLGSLMSTSLFSMARRLDVRSRNLFEVSAEAIGFAITVSLALVLRNVWAPILAILLSIAARSALTYALPHRRPRLRFDRVHATEIFHFSKWIMLASFALYAAVFIDRLYLARVLPLATLGLYGLARVIAELPNIVAGRLAFQIVFPFVAKHDADPAAGAMVRRELGRARRGFLLLVVVGVAGVMTVADIAVRLVYGPNFAAAGWMLCLLLASGWVSVLASLNEAIVYGRGAPRNVSAANLVRFAVMAAALPVGFTLGGLPGAILALPAGEGVRYLILLRPQRSAGLSFLRQDAAMTLALFGVFAAGVAIRAGLGLGVPWALMP